MTHRRRRWRAIVGIPVAILVLVWLGYKIANVRRATGRISADTGCESDAKTAANMSRIAPGAAPIRCEPWDIGTGVTGYVWHAPNARAALLIQTGWGDYAQRYVNQASHLIPHLLSKGISVYAFDMWGGGRSPGKRGATHIGQTVADHLAARRKLRDQPLPVFALGHSVGGLVTATSALTDQAGLVGMILLSPALDWGVSNSLRRVARIAGFLIPTFPVPGSGGGTLTADSAAQRVMDEDALMNHGRLTWVTAAGGSNVSHENWKRYAELRIPILVIHGGADRAPDPSGSRRFVAQVASSDKTLHVVPDALHNVLDDRAGSHTVEMIGDWISRRVVP
jgi:acylglycerol lipase